MNWYGYYGALAAILASALGCGKSDRQSDSSLVANMNTARTRERQVDAPNEFGFAKVSIRSENSYEEGIVDAQGNVVVPPRANMLVNDLADNLALLQVDRKFLFVPLDQGSVSLEDFAGVDGFQYAEPYRCGLALVIVNDVWFYIDSEGDKAFEADFEFAESFHHDRALVKAGDRYRIIDTQGKLVADLNYDQVTLQSPWCWQVTDVEHERYLSGFVDLNGETIAELIYDDVGYYDPAVKRIRVSKNERHGFLDEHAKVVIPVKYEDAEIFDRGKARVVLNGRSFFINPEGVEVPE